MQILVDPRRLDRRPTARGRRSGPDDACEAGARRRRIERLMRSAERAIARGRLSVGVRHCLEIRDLAPDNPSTLNRLGDLFLSAGEVEHALALFFRVGAAYAEEGFWAKAIAIYRKILRQDPGREDAVAQLAWLYQKSGLPTATASSSRPERWRTQGKVPYSERWPG